METQTSSLRSAFCASGTSSSQLALCSSTCLLTDARTRNRQEKVRTSTNNEFVAFNATRCSCLSQKG
eukprot:4625226-Prorocentrum_lima.AAC.1